MDGMGNKVSWSGWVINQNVNETACFQFLFFYKIFSSVTPMQSAIGLKQVEGKSQE